MSKEKLSEWGDGSEYFEGLFRITKEMRRRLAKAKETLEQDVEMKGVFPYKGGKKTWSKIIAIQKRIVRTHENQLALLLDWKEEIKGMTPKQVEALAEK